MKHSKHSNRHPPINRRAFVRGSAGLGGLALASLLLEGCTAADPTATPAATATQASAASAAAAAPTATSAPSPTRPPATATATPQTAATTAPTATASPTATPTIVPTPTRRSPMAQVAFVKTRDRAAGVKQALDLLDLDPVQGKSLFLKPNWNSADAPPGSTHNEALAALVRALQDRGAGPITIGDRSGMGDTRAVMERKGIFQLASELGLQTVVFDELGAEDWEHLQPEGSHWQRGFAVARPVLDADGVIQTCCLKTHRYGGHFTLSLKNSVGLAAKWVPGEGYNYMTELHNSPDQRRMIAEINTAYQPDLIVLDGVQAFVDGGPDTGKLVDSGVILAGTDRVAIDAVGVALLRYFGTTAAVSRGSIFGQEQLARAVELNLGVTGPEQIELVTPDSASASYADQIRQILAQG
jgi:uncharacterized protein (DUF362 family)